MTAALNELRAMSPHMRRGEPNWGTRILFLALGSFAVPMAIGVALIWAGYGQLNFALSAVYAIVATWLFVRQLSIWVGLSMVDVVRHWADRIINKNVGEANPTFKYLSAVAKLFVTWVWAMVFVVGILLPWLEVEDNTDLFATAVVMGLLAAMGLPWLAKDKFFNLLFKFYFEWVCLWAVGVLIAFSVFPALKPWGDDAAKVSYQVYRAQKRAGAKVAHDRMKVIEKTVIRELTRDGGQTLPQILVKLTADDQALFRYYNRNIVVRTADQFLYEVWPNAMKATFGIGTGMGLVNPIDRLKKEIEAGQAGHKRQLAIDCLEALNTRVAAHISVTPQEIQRCEALDPNYNKKEDPAPKTKAPASTAAEAVNAHVATAPATKPVPAPAAAPAAPATPVSGSQNKTFVQGSTESFELGTYSGSVKVMVIAETGKQRYNHTDASGYQEWHVDANGVFTDAGDHTLPAPNQAGIPLPGAPLGALVVLANGEVKGLVNTCHNVVGNSRLTMKVNHWPQWQGAGNRTWTIKVEGC